VEARVRREAAKRDEPQWRGRDTVVQTTVPNRNRNFAMVLKEGQPSAHRPAPGQFLWGHRWGTALRGIATAKKARCRDVRNVAAECGTTIRRGDAESRGLARLEFSSASGEPSLHGSSCHLNRWATWRRRSMGISSLAHWPLPASPLAVRCFFRGFCALAVPPSLPPSFSRATAGGFF
jgi:hypothetical protein